ncbi:hypothetical protein MMC19_003838 [Ptychographa xylographoides]|nr:hypothetical protein [Ptychographa xylographoides]
MALKPPTRDVDTVIIGNGPSALILSYILHGNIPYYDSSHPHPDPILHNKLAASPCLLNVDVADLTAHFGASRLSYSTQALPINVLLDTLIRPLADTEPGEIKSCVVWRYEPESAVRHIVLGNTARSGGQWADNPVAASWDIGALSYAEMLSLPGYTLLDHYKKIGRKQPADFYRPTRREIADYLATYPEAVGISGSMWPGTVAENITRTKDGFYIPSQHVHCRHLVLASGIFSHLLPARPQLQPLLRLPDHLAQSEPPLLVVGSGFTAADIIITALPKRKVIHIFKWSPEEHPSPLRACHVDAYPDYAGVYRRMKLSAIQLLGRDQVFTPDRKQKSNPFFNVRDWDQSYEGLPNTYIKNISIHDDIATVTLQASSGRTFERQISNLEYVIGRRGSLEYLERNLQREVLASSSLEVLHPDTISGQSLRAKTEVTTAVAPSVFVIGSLTGDSLIRFAFGGCVYAAREIMSDRSHADEGDSSEAPTVSSNVSKHRSNVYQLTNGHMDLGIERKGYSTPLGFGVIKCDI